MRFHPTSPGTISGPEPAPQGGVRANPSLQPTTKLTHFRATDEPFAI